MMLSTVNSKAPAALTAPAVRPAPDSQIPLAATRARAANPAVTRGDICMENPRKRADIIQFDEPNAPAERLLIGGKFASDPERSTPANVANLASPRTRIHMEYRAMRLKIVDLAAAVLAAATSAVAQNRPHLLPDP